MLVRGNEKDGIMERLKEWLANENGDLSKREGTWAADREEVEFHSARALDSLTDDVRM